VLGAEDGDGQRHQGGAGGGEGGHAQLAAAQAGDRRQLGLGGVQAGDDALGVLEQHAAGRGEADAAREAFDQVDARLVLEGGDLLGHSGLGVGQRVGGGRERAAVGDLDQHTESVHVKH
jgi:hypothetical protein